MGVTATCNTCDGYGTIASCGGEGCCEPDPCPECNATWVHERAELYAARRELAEWRGGKRRVFWRVRWTHSQKGPTHTDCVQRSWAHRMKGYVRNGYVYRVTVGPAKPKEAK